MRSHLNANIFSENIEHLIRRLRRHLPPLGKANKIHSSSDTSEDIIRLQFGKLNIIICRHKKPSPAWEEDDEDKAMPHKSLFAQIINLKKEQ